MCETSQEVISRIDALLQLTRESGVDGADYVEHLKILRNSCARGAHFQELVASHSELNNFLHSLLFKSDESIPWQQQHAMALQLLANAIVKNPTTQRSIWERHGEAIMQDCAAPPLGRNTDIKLMILYNVFQGDTRAIGEQQALLTIVRVWRAIVAERCEHNFDFLHFLFEHFLVKDGRITVRYYAQLPAEERICFLDYVSSYLRHDSPNGQVHTFLLQHLSKEFKMKSDCILRYTASDVDSQLNPREAYALLRVIASASGSERYETVYATDHALFLNVSSLLRCLVAAGKETTPNIFTPMNKLEEVALTSDVKLDFESEVSFELKTLLVRCVANLLYKNKTNQGYCVDTELMPTLFECTNMDARNPLIKEWSILAIRNACIGCPEIQQIIANLTKQGTVKNDILDELNLEMGSLRIKPNKN